jgi:hypothetical protein
MVSAAEPTTSVTYGMPSAGGGTPPVTISCLPTSGSASPRRRGDLHWRPTRSNNLDLLAVGHGVASCGLQRTSFVAFGDSITAGGRQSGDQQTGTQVFLVGRDYQPCSSTGAAYPGQAAKIRVIVGSRPKWRVISNLSASPDARRRLRSRSHLEGTNDLGARDSRVLRKP